MLHDRYSVFWKSFRRCISPETVIRPLQFAPTGQLWKQIAVCEVIGMVAMDLVLPIMSEEIHMAKATLETDHVPIIFC